jgi:hypothetical protein
VRGVRIEHVCGDPSRGPESDLLVRRRIVETALRALETPVEAGTIFEPGTP